MLKIIYFSKLIALYIIILNNSSFGQSPRFCGVIKSSLPCASDPDSLLYDRFGNSYCAINSPSESIGASNCSNAGYFNLIFSENTPLSAQMVACEVFFQLSNTIQRRQQQVTDCNEPWPQYTVNIQITWTDDIDIIDASTLGAASPLHFPPNLHRADLECAGVDLDLAYIKINGGAPYPMQSNLFLGNTIDGVIIINSALSWHYDWTQPPPQNKYDLYSVFLHEALHILAFYPRNPSMASGHDISIWNQLLYVTPEYEPNGGSQNLQPVYVSDCSKNCWTLNPNVFQNYQELLDELEVTCNSNNTFDFVVGSNAIAPISGPYGGNVTSDLNALSHLHETCDGSNLNYVMSPQLDLGQHRRTITDAELNILCELGYNVNSASVSCDGCYNISHSYTSSVFHYNCCDKFYSACVGKKIHIKSEDLLCHSFSNGASQEVTRIWPSVIPYSTFIDIVKSGSGWDITINAIPPGGWNDIFFKYTVKGCECSMHNATFSITVEECLPCGYSGNPCENLLCYSGFDDYYTGINLDKLLHAWFGRPFFLDLGALPYFSFGASIIRNDNNKYLILNHIFPVTFELNECIPPNCELNLDYSASITNQATIALEVWGSKYEPCLATSNPLIPVAPECDVTTNCNGYIFHPFCISNTTNITNLPDASGPNLQPYPTLKWLNNTQDEICYLTIRPSNADAGIALDNISAKKECKPNVDINSGAEIDKCIGQNFKIEFQICATSIPGISTTQLNLTLNIPPGLTLISGNPIISETLIENECVTFEFEFNIEINPLLQGNTLDLFLVGTASGFCANLEIEHHKSINIDVCLPCACTGLNSINIIADDQNGTSVLETIIPTMTVPHLNNPNSLIDKCIAIQGKLLIDQNYNLSLFGGEIRMQPGSEIIVKSGASLTFSSVNQDEGIHGCVEMWKGISVESAGELSMYTSVIQDAIRALTLYNNSTANLSSNKFNNNYIGIHIPPLPNTTQHINTIYPLQNNIFQSTRNLLYPYNDQIAYVGIELNNSAFIIGSPSGNSMNVFNNIRNGVIGYNSFVYINDGKFTQIVDAGPPQFPISTGYSIGIDHGTLIAEKCTTQIAKSFIYSLNSYTAAKNNFIGDVSTGFYVFAPFMGLYLEDNYLTSYTGLGMDLIGKSNTWNIKPSLTNNIFSPNNNNLTSGISLSYFTVGNPLGGNPLLSKIKNNIFNLNFKSNGIVLVGCDEIGVEENFIYYYYTSPPPQPNNYLANGICLVDTRRSNLFLNYISFPQSLSSINSNGIYTGWTSSTSNVYCCNTITGAQFGFNFEGNTYNSLLKNNNLLSNIKALSCSGILGDLNFLTNNSWNGDVEHTGSFQDRDNSTFTIHTCNTPKWPNSISPVQSCNPSSITNWFLRFDAQVSECTEDRICSRRLFNLHDNELENFIYEDTISNFDISVANKDFTNDTYGDLMQSETSRWLFRKLTVFPNLIGLNSTIDSFYYENYNNTMLFQGIEDSLSKNIHIDSVYVIELRDIEIRISDILLEINSIDSTIRLSDSLAIPDSLKLMKHIIIQSLSIEIDSLTRIKQKMHNRYIEKILVAEQINSLIEPYSVIDQNEKIANKVFFATIDRGIAALDSQQLALITPIAYQCIPEGGRGVIKARQLYKLHNDTINFSDIDNNCIPYEERDFEKFDKNTEPKKMVLRPNPTKDIVHIELSPENTLPVNIILKSLDNRVVKDFWIDEYSTTFSILGLPPGIYFCSILSKNNNIITVKLVVI